MKTRYGTAISVEFGHAGVPEGRRGRGRKSEMEARRRKYIKIRQVENEKKPPK